LRPDGDFRKDSEFKQEVLDALIAQDWKPNLAVALDECKALGAEVRVWDLVEKPLPLVGAEGSWDDSNVKEFQALAIECDGYILTSPEYHGTMSGVMKNTLDWVYKDHVGGKAFGLMSTLGGITNSNTLNHMRNPPYKPPLQPHRPTRPSWH
jgi:FMN reductase